MVFYSFIMRIVKIPSTMTPRKNKLLKYYSLHLIKCNCSLKTFVVGFKLSLKWLIYSKIVEVVLESKYATLFTENQ